MYAITKPAMDRKPLQVMGVERYGKQFELCDKYKLVRNYFFTFIWLIMFIWRLQVITSVISRVLL